MLGVRDLARCERLAFADLLDGLTAAEWMTPSLCDGWTVRDVAAHTIGYLGQSRSVLLANMVRHHGEVDRLNARLLPRHTALPPRRLAELMRSDADPSGTGALYGCRVALVETVLHQIDVRRPLHLPRAVPEPHLRAALRFAWVSPVLGGARRTRGVRLIATDLDWAAGRGVTVYGPAEALLLAMTGRTKPVIDELHGKGLSRIH